MRRKSYLFSLLCCLVKITVASYCYPDYCHNVTTLHMVPDFPCVLTTVRTDEDCSKLKFESSSPMPARPVTEKFLLSAYVKVCEECYVRATAFNFSIENAHFYRLVTRYQSLVDEKLSACRYIWLNGNATHAAPKELYVSCPFSDDTFESSHYQLEYQVFGNNYDYTKKYVFTVPKSKLIDESTDVTMYTPFVYVDVSDIPNLSLYIQPLPQRFNVSAYGIWLINNDTNSAMYVDAVMKETDSHIKRDFTVQAGSYYFKVAASHSTCTEYGCANSTTPLITIKEASHRILIMIISIVWIPPVLLYVFYHLYKMYRKREVERQTREKQNCLLVYSPTHSAHVNAMVALAKYLRCCNIGAMIDILDIPKTQTQDPGLWCNAAFRDAHVILVATSPPRKGSVPVIYRNVDNHVLRLLKENYPRRDKKYYVVQFPYCDPENVPEEARCFKRFYMPEELLKLVKAIQTVGISVKRITASSNEFLDTINTAKLELAESITPTQKVIKETDDLLMAIGGQEKTMNDESDQNHFLDIPDMVERSETPQFFSTNIDELNLLGECSEDREGTFVTKSSLPDGCKFHIDELEL